MNHTHGPDGLLIPLPTRRSRPIRTSRCARPVAAAVDCALTATGVLAGALQRLAAR